MFAEVAVNVPPVRGTFHYHIPPKLDGGIQAGHLVIVPFGRRRVYGIVTRLIPTADVPETRPIESLVDPSPVVTPAQLRLASWMAERYLAAPIDCLTLMLPAGLAQAADSIYELVDPDARGASPAQEKIIDTLRRRGQLRGRQIERAFGRMDWRRAVEALVRRAVVRRESILVPPAVRPRRLRTVTLDVPTSQALSSLGDDARPASARRRALIELLSRESGPLEVNWVHAETGANAADLRRLETLGLIRLGEVETLRDPLARTEFVLDQPPRLTRDQSQAWEAIGPALTAPPATGPRSFLLQGVTGSGKTEIYLRAVETILATGRSAIILVPEIALTPQTTARFLARFPGRVGLQHSGLSEGERYDTWRRCRSGQLSLVIGPRSALFSPLSNIGLIVLDEEHDESFKEESQSPRYHARDTALAYAADLGAVCLLGSATPAIETSRRAELGELIHLRLPQRILGHREHLRQQAAGRQTTRFRATEVDADYAELPPVRIVDMRQELRAGNASLFSRALRQGLEGTLAAGEQAILFLNRRGTATFVFCRDCGWIARCSRCDGTLTYHAQAQDLICHRCGATRRPPARCPNCRSPRVKYFGAGTQRIQAEVERAFPSARTLRWDYDVTRTKGSHEAILAHFAAHRADILIGTQMIAKGLDLPLVTLVGVISADVGLELPDFRAAERTFQVLTQVSGRAGRSPLGGRVVLQTYVPDHYAIQAAASHNYDAFYKQELRQRRDLGYPPYRRLTRLVVHHSSEESARREAEGMARRLLIAISRMEAQAELIGPAPCFYTRLRGEFRWQIVLRSQDPNAIVPAELPAGWIVDVDPVSLL